MDFTKDHKNKVNSLLMEKWGYGKKKMEEEGPFPTSREPSTTTTTKNGTNGSKSGPAPKPESGDAIAAAKGGIPLPAKALEEAKKLATIDRLTSKGPQIFGKIFPPAEKSRQQRILDASSIVNPAHQYQMDNLFMYPYGLASGGRAGLSGGDTSGRPPESGPMSQGLRSLYNNGRKL